MWERETGNMNCGGSFRAGRGHALSESENLSPRTLTRALSHVGPIGFEQVSMQIMRFSPIQVPYTISAGQPQWKKMPLTDTTKWAPQALYLAALLLALE